MSQIRFVSALVSSALIAHYALSAQASWTIANPHDRMPPVRHIDVTGMGPESESETLTLTRDLPDGGSALIGDWDIITHSGAIPDDPFELTVWSKTVHGQDADGKAPWDNELVKGTYRLTIGDGPLALASFKVTSMPMTPLPWSLELANPLAEHSAHPRIL